jgi:hypothetical protein
LSFQSSNFCARLVKQFFSLGKLLLKRCDVIALPGAMPTLILAHSVQGVLC